MWLFLTDLLLFWSPLERGLTLIMLATTTHNTGDVNWTGPFVPEKANTVRGQLKVKINLQICNTGLYTILDFMQYWT